MICTGLEKAALTTWCTTNPLPTGVARPVIFFLHSAPKWWDGGTRSDFLPQCHPAVPCSDSSHHLPTPGEFFPMTTMSRVIKERYFSVIFPLLLVKVPQKQGNQVVFTLSGLCSCVFKHWLQNNCFPYQTSTLCPVTLCVRHRLWISLPWNLQKTVLLTATSFKWAPDVLNEKFSWVDQYSGSLLSYIKPGCR